MAAGRPTIWDVEFLSKELLDWAERSDSLNLNAFCTQQNIMIAPTTLIEIKDRAGNEQLSEAYKIAKSYLATRREVANSEKLLSDQAYKCNLRVYDAINREDWKKEKRFESELDKAASVDSSKAVTALCSKEHSQP
jgi:hypothetical protein